MIRDIEIRAARPSLEEAQAIVGGLIEIVIDDGEKQLIVNEEGLLLGLPFNETASRMTGRHIVGPALLLAGEAMLD